MFLNILSVKNSYSIVTIFFIALIIPHKIQAQIATWEVPKDSQEIQNPLENSERVLNAGKQIYAQLCAVCHGNKGAGDGITAAALQPKPANFTLVTFQEQTDGAIYHKIREGRPPMPGYETQLTEQQTWAIVHYLRTLSDKTSNN